MYAAAQVKRLFCTVSRYKTTPAYLILAFYCVMYFAATLHSLSQKVIPYVKFFFTRYQRRTAVCLRHREFFFYFSSFRYAMRK